MFVKKHSPIRLTVAACLAATLTGCSLFGGDRPSYEQSGETRPLEVPPDLIEPPGDSRMAIPPLDGGRVSALETARQESLTVGGSTTPASAEVLPQYPGMRVRHEGGVRWLEVDADAAVLWPQMNDFWREAGLELARSDPRLGIIQTEWTEPSSIAGLRDSYRLRLERQDVETTNVYITHRGATRAGESAASWQPRPSDPGLEAEYLTRLMVYLGAPAQTAERQIAAADDGATRMRLDQVAGIPVLVVKGQFPKVWQLTGIALDRAGLPVEEEDVVNGTYYFRYEPAVAGSAGVLTGLPADEDAKLKENARYQVHLLDQPGQTLITAHTAAHEALPTGAAEEILTRLITSMQNGQGGAQLGTLSPSAPDGA
jgi:outer membrane protein assembly factor BamC